MSLLHIFNSIKHKLSPSSNTVVLASDAAQAPVLSAPAERDPALMQALADVLLLEGISFEWRETGLLLASGMLLQAEPIESLTLGEGRVRTCTKLYISHPDYFPQGISEYQHAMGASEAQAIAEGFRAWTQMDLIALTDATRETPLDCTVIEMSVVAGPQADGFARFRQVVLGPVAHLATLAAPEPKEEHPFCPCCLFTESTAAFHDLLQSDQFLGVRLFVSRDSLGKLAVDCRVNGENFAAVQDVLTAYASRWPERGLEFRKQYLVIRSIKRSV
jgi:hypothetical protein